jgi:hypothetical protein
LFQFIEEKIAVQQQPFAQFVFPDFLVLAHLRFIRLLVVTGESRLHQRLHAGVCFRIVRQQILIEKEGQFVGVLCRMVEKALPHLRAFFHRSLQAMAVLAAANWQGAAQASRAVAE